MKRIVRFTIGNIYWPAFSRPSGEVLVQGVKVRVPQVLRVDFDAHGNPVRIESPLTIFVQVKEG